MNIELDLSEARLPIAGNTELVPNSTQGTSTLNFTQRVNEYVSWYLNGIIQRAEEDYFTVPTNEFEIINLSGPIRKLFPREIQTSWRIAERSDGAARQIRHDQIAVCTDGNPEACYSY